MGTSKGSGATIFDEVVLPFCKNGLACEAHGVDPGSKSGFEKRIQYATAQDLLNAWDCDLWHLSQSPLNPDLKPLTAEELEGLVTRFRDVMHVYVLPDAVLFETILFETAASELALVKVARRELVFSSEVQIQVHTCGGIEISEYCGGKKSTVYVLAFNTLRVRAILQILAAESHRS